MQGFQSVYKPQRSGAVQFAELLDAVASVDPEMRIRFTSPHPKDFSDDVLKVSTLLPAMLQAYVDNLCQAASSGIAAASYRLGFCRLEQFDAYNPACSCICISVACILHEPAGTQPCAQLALMDTLSMNAAGDCHPSKCVQTVAHASTKWQLQHAGAHAKRIYASGL